MKKVKIWIPKIHEYVPWEVPDGALLYSNNMHEICQCARCGKNMMFGDCYTSKQIHNDFGFGYGVCRSCYDLEWKEELRK